MTIRVETQGISPDFTQVNGDHDPIDRGEVSAKDLKGMLLRLSQLPPLPDAPGTDYCPPALFATGADANWSFRHDGRGLFCDELDDYVDPAGGVKQVTGSASSTSRGRRKFPKGRVPQRHPGLEPANDVSLRREDVDQSSPFIAMTARSESTTWKGLFYVGSVLIALAATVMGMGVSSGGMPGAALGAALLCAVVGVPMIGWAVTHWSEPLAAGVDWGTNTMWIRRADRFRLVSHANCIVTVDVSKHVESAGVHESTHHESTHYEIYARYSGGLPGRVGRFDRKNEAQEVAGRLMAALAQTPLPSRFAAPPMAPAGLPACPRCRVRAQAGDRFCGACGGPLG